MDAGGTDMQFASRVPTEILQVVQALVLMFVAAPAILRYLFRLRTTQVDTTTFSAGWGKR
jgi:simple sugar transport system permease protein